MIKDIISVNKRENVNAKCRSFASKEAKGTRRKKKKKSQTYIQITGKNLLTSFLTTLFQKQKEASLEFRPH